MHQRVRGMGTAVTRALCHSGFGVHNVLPLISLCARLSSNRITGSGPRGMLRALTKRCVALLVILPMAPRHIEVLHQAAAPFRVSFPPPHPASRALDGIPFRALIGGGVLCSSGLILYMG